MSHGKSEGNQGGQLNPNDPTWARNLPIFDHNDPGTPEASWATDRRLAGAKRLPLPGADAHLVVVAAHPDDETLGAGGLIATTARSGVQVAVIVGTNGEASHPASPTHTPQQLAARRRVEVTSAMLALGVGTVIQLGLPDGQLDRHLETLEQAIDDALQPGSLLLTPWRGDRHPDHAACDRAAQNVLRRWPDTEHWQYPIWAWHWGDPSDPPWEWEDVARLELEPDVRVAKQAAIACHRSQNQPLSDLDGDEAILSESFLAHFRRPYETFLLDSLAARDRAPDPPSGTSA
jgi:LmbE family N-acetylglucosaminyl deacetylase